MVHRAATAGVAARRLHGSASDRPGRSLPGASGRGCSDEVVLVTEQYPVVDLPSGDHWAPAQLEALQGARPGQEEALWRMLTAERVRYERPKLTKSEVELALWLRGVQPARKAWLRGVQPARKAAERAALSLSPCLCFTLYLPPARTNLLLLIAKNTSTSYAIQCCCCERKLCHVDQFTVARLHAW